MESVSVVTGDQLGMKIESRLNSTMLDQCSCVPVLTSAFGTKAIFAQM
jgi:hypothetical protein